MQVKELMYPSTGTVPYLNVQTRASWGAILVGAIVATATFIMLGTLGMGIGLMSAPAAASPSSLGMGLGIGALAWYLIASIVSFYLGGWFAGRLTGIGRVSESVLHGIASWGVVTVVVAFLTVFTAAKALPGALGTLGQSFSSGIGGAAAGLSGETDLRDAPGDIKEKAGDVREKVREFRREAGADLREAPASVERGAKAAGAAGLFGFFVLLIQAASAGYGARAGTRVLRPAGMESHRTR